MRHIQSLVVFCWLAANISANTSNQVSRCLYIVNYTVSGTSDAPIKLLNTTERMLRTRKREQSHSASSSSSLRE